MSFVWWEKRYLCFNNEETTIEWYKYKFRVCCPQISINNLTAEKFNILILVKNVDFFVIQWIIIMQSFCKGFELTNWDRVMHICVIKLTMTGSDNGLSPGRRQAIMKTQCWNSVNLTPRNKLQWNYNRYTYKHFHLKIHLKKSIRKYRLENGGHLFLASMC